MCRLSFLKPAPPHWGRLSQHHPLATYYFSLKHHVLPSIEDAIVGPWLQNENKGYLCGPSAACESPPRPPLKQIFFHGHNRSDLSILVSSLQRGVAIILCTEVSPKFSSYVELTTYVVLFNNQCLLQPPPPSLPRALFFPSGFFNITPRTGRTSVVAG